jgi:hypothetical protein
MFFAACSAHTTASNDPCAIVYRRWFAIGSPWERAGNAMKAECALPSKSARAFDGERPALLGLSGMGVSIGVPKNSGS